MTIMQQMERKRVYRRNITALSVPQSRISLKRALKSTLHAHTWVCCWLVGVCVCAVMVCGYCISASGGGDGGGPPAARL